jgi:hypothetical protein
MYEWWRDFQQVVGQPWEVETVLAIMHIIDSALGPRGFGPGSWRPSKLAGGDADVGQGR